MPARGRTRPACSAPSSTARPATSASGPSSTQVPHQRRYVPGTMVLETTWHTPTGWLLVQDLLVVEPGDRRDAATRLPPVARRRRRHGDPAAAGHLHRGARRGRGQRRAASSSTGSQTGMWDYDGDGYETMTVSPPAGDPVLTVSLHPPSRRRRGPLLRPLDPGEGASRPSSPCPGAAIRPPTSTRRRPSSTATVAYWRDWLSNGTFPDHPWRSYMERSALTLKGLSYAPTGAIMAAATTSLPETPGRGPQLGLPLHLDPRLLVHVALALPARVRLGGARVLRLRHRGAGRARARTGTCRSCTASTAART